jgi:hypothetical protein
MIFPIRHQLDEQEQTQRTDENQASLSRLPGDLKRFTCDLPQHLG